MDKLELVAVYNLYGTQLYMDCIKEMPDDEALYVGKFRTLKYLRIIEIFKEYPLNYKLGGVFIYKNEEHVYLLNCFNKYKNIPELVKNFNTNSIDFTNLTDVLRYKIKKLVETSEENYFKHDIVHGFLRRHIKENMKYIDYDTYEEQLIKLN